MKRLEKYDPTNESLFITSKGFLGKDFSRVVETGDIICVLLGCPAPVALRQVGSHYEVIRAVYVDGIMCGEAIEALKGRAGGLRASLKPKVFRFRGHWQIPIMM
jgi:hypothetical protein